MSALRDAALRYAEHGWRVIPLHGIDGSACTCRRTLCEHPGKHPRTAHGVHDATADPDTIRGWSTRWPSANFGIATGAGSGLVVIDVDPDKGGHESLAALEAEHGALPDTIEALTGGSGRHLYFDHPGHDVANPVGVRPGIDIRGDGGYVVAPPALHASGRAYAWRLGYAPEELPLAPLPSWVAALLDRPHSRKSAPDGARIPKGTRNATLASLAGTMRRRGMTEEEITAALRAVNPRCDPPLSEAEVCEIAASIAAYPPEPPQPSDEAAAAPLASRPALTGAQSFIDGVLVYGLRYEGTVVYATSQGEVLSATEASARYRVIEPDVPTRLSLEALAAVRTRDPIPDGRSLLEDLIALLARHVAWPSSSTPGLVALWIMGTYLHRIFTFFPYIALTSGTKRAGKSLVEEILSELAFNATPPQVNPTPATLYRDIHFNCSTVILDEVEGLGGGDHERRAELLAVLNCGFKHDGTVPRMEKHGAKHHLVRYRAYSPKVLASIREVADTVRDRSLLIRLQRKRREDVVVRFNVRALTSTLAGLRDRLHRWALGAAPQVAAAYGLDGELPIPNGVDDRARDILEPLYAVARVIDMSGGMPAATPLLVRATLELMVTRGDDEGDLTVALAVEALKRRFENGAGHAIVLRADDAVPHFAEAGLSWVTEPKHARALFRRLGFTSGSHRMHGKVVRGYEITRAQVEDLAARYLAPAGEEGAHA